MHKQWPFFRTLLSNLDIVLAKTNRGNHITINGLAAGVAQYRVSAGGQGRRQSETRDRADVAA